ncbi:MAG TPA: hypothetical protein VMI75_30265 [Polyangiaceae bacterium]|nr:hypothetical protein [Polyangiaceae bacterium]
MHSRLFFLLAISGLAVSTGLWACSSNGSAGHSPTSPGGGGDGGVDFGGFGSSGSSGAGAASSGTGSASGSSSGTGSTPPCMPPSSVPSSELVPYVTAQQQLNACTSTQISDYIAACVPNGSTTMCHNWEQSNTKCAQCIAPTNGSGVGQNTGAMLFDVHGNLVDYNFGGCIALIDPTSGGLACAQALDAYVQCIDFACEACSDQMSIDNCQSTATNGGACSAYNDAYHMPCKTDLAVDAGGNTKCSTGTQVISVICGPGM